MSSSDFAILTRESSLWGSLVGTTLAMVLSSYSLVTSTTGSGLALEYQIVLCVGCVLISFRFFLHALFSARDSVKVFVLRKLNNRQRGILFAMQVLLVLCCGISIAVLRSYGFSATGVLFLVQSLTVTVMWLVVFNPIFTDEIEEVERGRKYYMRYSLTVILDLCMIPLSVVLLLQSSFESDVERGPVALAIGIYFLFSLLELALHAIDDEDKAQAS